VGNLIDACRYITGETVSAEMLNRWGQGCVNLIKAFDWREGQHPRNLRLADKFFKQDLRGSENMFAALDPEIWRRRRETYFALRGWSLEGEPKLTAGP
jgi:aldehyde:ferredoxin oxidoreductase